MKKSLASLTLLAFVVLTFQQNLQASVGSVTTGTGRAGVASVEASEVAWTNPAGIAHSKGYYFSSAFRNEASEKLRGNSWNLSLVDNLKETVFPASLSFEQSSLKYESNSNASAVQTPDELKRDFRLGFGNFVSNTVAFGLNINHSEDLLAQKNYSATNFGTGLLWTPNMNMGFGVYVDDILPATQGTPENFKPERRIEVGYSYNYRRFLRFKADIASAKNQDFTHPWIKGGIEYYINKWVIARIGASKLTEADANTFSGGIGLALPKFLLSYAYESAGQTSGQAGIPFETRHLIDLAIPVW